MGTHTPAQAIQELVNHTAVLTERLVGLQTEVRKGMQQTPEWSNALTQVVGDTKRMLQAMEHLARLPAFHLDREGLNAAVAAGVRAGMSDEGGSLAAIIESNSKHLEEAKSELSDAKIRMDQLLNEVQSSRNFKMDAQKRLFIQIAPVAGIWSVGCVLLGLLFGSLSSCSEKKSAPPQPPAAQQQSLGPAVGSKITTTSPLQLFDRPSGAAKFNAPAGVALSIVQVDATGWVQVSFAQGPGKTGTAWVAPGLLR